MRLRWMILVDASPPEGCPLERAAVAVLQGGSLCDVVTRIKAYRNRTR